MTKTELLLKVDSKIHPKLYCYLPNITFLLSHAAFFYLREKHPPPPVTPKSKYIYLLFGYTVHARLYVCFERLVNNNFQGNKMLHFVSNIHIFIFIPLIKY